MIAEAATLEGRRILIVEDDYLVAQVLIDLLEEAGAVAVGPLGQIEEAIAFIQDENHLIDGAVLDINLHGRKSYPVADALASRAVSFVFATGYDASVIEGKYQQYPRCEKPFNLRSLLAALTAR